MRDRKQKNSAQLNFLKTLQTAEVSDDSIIMAEDTKVITDINLEERLLLVEFHQCLKCISSIQNVSHRKQTVIQFMFGLIKKVVKLFLPLYDTIG